MVTETDEITDSTSTDVFTQLTVNSLNASFPEVGLAIRTNCHSIDLSFDKYGGVLAAEQIHNMTDLRIFHGQRRLVFLVLLQLTSQSQFDDDEIKTRTIAHLLPSNANFAGFFPMSAWGFAGLAGFLGAEDQTNHVSNHV